MASHPRASAFHQRGWLEALARTYGYEPFVLTTNSAGQRLRNAVLVCRVSSWITGKRFVCLPFADHCEPLLDDIDALREFVYWLTRECQLQGYKYIELRLLGQVLDLGYGLRPSHSYCFHELDIRPSLRQIFEGLHKDCIQRKIRRAEREQLVCELGRSDQFVTEFFQLLLMTRRRHQLPPQPRLWFRNLVECMGDNIEIRLARKHGVPIAAILTLKHRASVIYKYGCSNDKFRHLGAMPFLFWRLIEDSKTLGLETIDFGRSELDNNGLITFKDRFGATRKLLTYYRYSVAEKDGITTEWGLRAMRQIFSVLPDAVLSMAGRVLYRHIG